MKYRQKFIGVSFALWVGVFLAPVVSTAKVQCPESFQDYWSRFRKAVEKDRMIDIKFLSHFPVLLISADGKQKKELGPKEFQSVYYKVMAEKCDVMDPKNQKQWILKHKELPTKSAFFTCSKKWIQVCNFEFNFQEARWRLTKINTARKNLFSKKH